MRVSPRTAASMADIAQHLAKHNDIPAQSIQGVRILKRSIDARQRNVVVNLKVRVYIDEPMTQDYLVPPIDYRPVDGKRQAIVVGMGPGGLFAALRLIELGIKPIVLSKDEALAVKSIGEKVSLDVDKKEGYLTLTVVGSEPIQTTELGTKALELLQEEITRFRTDKVKSELEYIQARYDEVKKETESLQAALAALTDRSQDMPSSRSKMERERLQTKYNVSNTVYMELAKQLEQAKLQVKKETPVFAILQPITVPTRPANSRARTLIVWTFMGFIIGCGIVFCKGAWPGIKEKFQKKEEEGD